MQNSRAEDNYEWGIRVPRVFVTFCRSKSKTKKKHKERTARGAPRNKMRELPTHPMNNNRYSTAFITIKAFACYLLAVFSVITFS